MGQGFVEGASETVTGMTELIAKPGAAVKGLATIVKNPIKSAKLMVKEGIKSCRQNAGKCVGKLAFEVASAVATAGAAGATSTGTKGAKGAF